MLDAYLPKTEHYPTKLVSPPAIVQRLSAEELRSLRKIPLEVMVAQNEPSEANSTNPRYTSVDEILIGLPFVPVNKDTFEREKVNGDVVLFFYNSQYDRGEFNHRLARVFREVLSDGYKNIKFLSYDRSKEPTVTQSFYLKKFKFSGEPFVGFYRNGEEIFRIDGGPKSDEYTAQWIPWLKEQIRIKFNRGS